MNIRNKMGLVTIGVGALVLSACGSNSLSGEPEGSSEGRHRGGENDPPRAAQPQGYLATSPTVGCPDN